jgi:hypothetical protein
MKANRLVPPMEEVQARYCRLYRMPLAWAFSMAITIAGTIVTPGSTFAVSSF